MRSIPIRMILLFVGIPVALALVFGKSLWPLLVAYVLWIALMMWWFFAGKKGGAKKADRGAVLFVLFLFFGLPTALAYVVADSWRTILVAYAIWFGLLGLGCWPACRPDAQTDPRSPDGRSSWECSSPWPRCRC